MGKTKTTKKHYKNIKHDNKKQTYSKKKKETQQKKGKTTR